MKNYLINSVAVFPCSGTTEIKPNTEKLRDYQEAATQAVVNVINETNVMDIVEMPTGSGKSRVIAAIAARFPDKRVLILTPRRKLLKQTRPVLGDHGVLSGTLGRDLGDRHKLIIATIQTAIRIENLIAPDLILIDEVHFISNYGAYAQLLRKYPNAKVVGFTATPYRENQHLVKGIYGSQYHLPWRVLYKKDMIELIKDKYLVAPVSMSTSAMDSFEIIERHDRLIVTKHNIVHLVNSVLRNDRKRCVVFCEDIEHAKITASFLWAQEQTSVHLVHSKMSSETQEFAYDQFEKSEGISWLVNVGLVSVGVDIPCIDVIAIMRDVGSIALLIQMIGRGLRPFGSKANCLVYDFGNGTSRFGFIDSPKLRDSTTEGNKCSDENHVFKTCSVCHALLHPNAKTCKKCNAELDQAVKINAEAKSVQLLSSSTQVSSPGMSNHLFVTYGGATQEAQPNGAWLITHTLYCETQRLIAYEAVSNFKSDPNKFQLGDKVLIKQLSRGDVEFVQQYKIRPVLRRNSHVRRAPMQSIGTSKTSEMRRSS